MANSRAEQLHSLETACRERWGISVVTYRFIKATTELVGVCLVGIMWSYGSLRVEIAAAIIGGVIFGAEWIETFLERQGAAANAVEQGGTNNDDDSGN